MAKRGYVYIMANRKHGTLYTGVTSNLSARVYQHKQATASAFTRRYKVHRLVYFESSSRLPTLFAERTPSRVGRAPGRSERSKPSISTGRI
jgi:predicted GIY-YIG superfamily endonuclease